MGYTVRIVSRTQVEVRDSRSGNDVCTCGTCAQCGILSAFISGDEVIMNLADGRVEVHDAKSGHYISCR